ncbi:MAG: proline/glycine betaine ABC transporter permease [Desulfohalobiaceae bacterium]
MWDIPVGQWIESLVDFLLRYFTGLFDFISYIVGSVTTTFESMLQGIPSWLVIAIVVVLAFWRLTWRYTLVFLLALLLILGMGMWPATIATLALVVTATVLSLVFAIPLGIWMSKSDRVEGIFRPILDFMQTMPPFVYLIPAAMFFGLGKVPGAIATITFCTPPAVRLTNLGIRQVPKELREAALAFGCTPMQLLRKVEIPIAMPSIMAGVNQNIMMALSMVVIASMIGAGGLGNVVLSGIQRMDIGLGFEGGLGVVVLAIILDRLTQSFSQRQNTGFIQRFKNLFKGELA